MYQMFRMLFSLNNDTLILFSQKNFYVQEMDVEKMQKPSAIVTTINCLEKLVDRVDLVE